MNDKHLLLIKDLKASIDNKEILKGVDLEVKPGELHVLMGPNGSGKSTLAQVLMGRSQFIVHSSQLTFNGVDLTKLTADKRAKLGIFLGFQHPVEVPGVSVFNMLRRAKHGQISPRLTISAFREQLLEYASSLKLGEDFLGRSLNEGFSGGEKKRNEILQMMALSPKLAILDEIDSGLDVDGLKLVAKAVKQFTRFAREARRAVHSSQSSIILITHYARILKYLKADFVHVMVDGRIVKSGNRTLAAQIESKGYSDMFIVNRRSFIATTTMND